MERKLKFIVFFIFTFIYQFGCFGQTKEDKILQVENGLIPFVPIEGFHKWNIHERMKLYNVKGVSIAVINNFKVEWAKGYGLADTLKLLPVTDQTIFSAGSISKMVMSLAAMKLVEEKKLSLDEPINNYLKSWKLSDNNFTKKKQVTLRMLLSHTAGTSQSSYFGFTPDTKKLPTLLDILRGKKIAGTRAVGVIKEPGTGFQYSGGGSMIAQMAIVDASGMSFEDYTQKAIFQPLEMTNATFIQPLPPEYQVKASWGYSKAPWYKGEPYVYPQQAAAGLHCSATDLAKFIIEIQKGYHGKSSIITQKSVVTMLTPQAEISNGAYLEQSGVGPFLVSRRGVSSDKGRYFEFQGANAGFIAYAIGNFSEGYGAVIMLNSGDDFNGLAMEIRRAIAQTYGWYQFLPETIVPKKDINLENYVGRYRKSIDEVVYIKKENDYLVEKINDGNDIYCFPIGNNTVVFTDYNVKGFFETDISGKAISLRSEFQEQPMPLMGNDEFTPFELFKLKKYAEAKNIIKSLNLNVSQLTYYAYEMYGKPVINYDAIKAVLEVAEEQYPKESIVYVRWSEYYYKIGNKEKAIEYGETAIKYAPYDKELKRELLKLKKNIK